MMTTSTLTSSRRVRKRSVTGRKRRRLTKPRINRRTNPANLRPMSRPHVVSVRAEMLLAWSHADNVPLATTTTAAGSAMRENDSATDRPARPATTIAAKPPTQTLAASRCVTSAPTATAASGAVLAWPTIAGARSATAPPMSAAPSAAAGRRTQPRRDDQECAGRPHDRREPQACRTDRLRQKLHRSRGVSVPTQRSPDRRVRPPRRRTPRERAGELFPSGVVRRLPRFHRPGWRSGEARPCRAAQG